MNKELIKELKEKYEFEETNKYLLFINDSCKSYIYLSGFIRLDESGFSVTNAKCSENLIFSFLKDPFNYYEYRNERTTELIKYFYKYKKDKNIKLINVNNLNIIYKIEGETSIRTCYIDLFTGKITNEKNT